jgi:hypothetical protein
MPRITPSCAEQGIPKAKSRVAMRRHRTATEAQHHRQRRLAVESHQAHNTVRQNRESRQIAAVLQQAEGDEKGPHHRQHNGDCIRQPHGHQAIFADDEFTEKPRRQEPPDQGDQKLSENDVFEQANQSLRPCIADELIEQQQSQDQDRNPSRSAPRQDPDLVRKPPAARDQDAERNDDRGYEEQEVERLERQTEFPAAR